MFAGTILPFAVCLIVALAVPGPVSKRIVWGVAAGVISWVLFLLFFPMVGLWHRENPDSVLIWEAPKNLTPGN
jgi:uncharacterized membrane protein YjfL (UPF0719 family)